jgi:hypothetical protein
VRINIYAEELPDERAVERVSKTADTGRTYFGARLYPGRRPRYGIVAYICGALSAGSGALCGGKP